MATNNIINVGLSGASGTGNFAGTTSPTFVTPTLGAATSTSLTFSPTTGGIVGTTTNDNAGAGKVGEIISSNIAFASATSLTSPTAKDVTSISLTAGDWNVYGNVGFNGGATTIVGQLLGWISATSATIPDRSTVCQLGWNPSNAIFAVAQPSFQVPYYRATLSGTTTIYLSVLANFSTSTCTAFGQIFARRVR